MGIAQYRTDVPTVKTTSGILALSSKRVIIEPNPKCIRCGKCVDVCPMNLLPCNLSIYARKQNFEELQKLNVMSCIECGTCSFICPGRMHLVQEIRDATAKLSEINRKQEKKPAI